MSDLQAQFNRFHADNPDVWLEFERLCLRVIARGRTHWSADACLHVLRFNRDMRTTGAGEVDGQPLKLNNSHAPFYARMFIAKYPEHDDFFHTRHSKADGEIVGASPRHNAEVNS
jgi:hypothetical protein